MSHDEVRKLLGGYATNTLTEAERKALFAAALQDQEVFDALQHEQALKDLLDDPVSRDQIRCALEQPLVSKAWWSRWWTWAGAASAVAAAVLIVAVVRSNAPLQAPEYASIDSTKPAANAPKPASVQSVEKLERDSKLKALRLNPPVIQPGDAHLAKHSVASDAARASRTGAAGLRKERKDELASENAQIVTASPAPALPPISTQQVQVQAQSRAVVPSQSRGTESQALSQQSAVQLQNSLREQKQDQLKISQASAGVGGGALSSLPVNYSVLKRDGSGAYQPLARAVELQTGDAIRFNVVPTLPGYLFLSRQNASGQWMRVYPETGLGLPVSANATYMIPDSPISVTDSDQNLRLALVPAIALETSAGRLKAKSTLAKKESAASALIVVDIIIASKKVP